MLQVDMKPVIPMFEWFSAICVFDYVVTIIGIGLY